MTKPAPRYAFLLCITVLLAAGCSSVRPARVARGGAPRLGEGLANGRPGVSNPNGPFLVADHSVRLVKRPTLLDINAARPCEAGSLSLFESGASVSGDHRTVRLNLVNHGPEACRLGGYPAISLLRQDGSVLGSIEIEKVSAMTLDASMRQSPASSTGAAALQPSPMILLVPSGEAAFEVGWTSGETPRSCEQVGSIVIAAPGTRQSFAVPHPLRVCEGRIRLTALSDASPY